jgi:hypothetical protein
MVVVISTIPSSGPIWLLMAKVEVATPLVCMYVRVIYVSYSYHICINEMTYASMCVSCKTGELAKAIDLQFGGLEKFKTSLAGQSGSVQGSGWGWLGYNKASGALQIATKPNQDPLTELVPLLGIDVIALSSSLQPCSLLSQNINIWQCDNRYGSMLTIYNTRMFVPII